MGRLALGVLISGRGSNMVALAEACAAPDFPAYVAVVISNVADAVGLERAAELQLPVVVVEHQRAADRQAFEAQLHETLVAHGVELVCLAGFMRLLTPGFIEGYRDRILNVHPSVLPAFPGLHAQRQALEYGVRWSGCTVHLVSEEMDAGPIVAQASVPIHQDDTEETLSARILRQEHRIYPEVVRWFAEDRLDINGRLVTVSSAARAGNRPAAEDKR